MPRRIIERIREKVRSGQYDMTSHATDEMGEDRLDIHDVESAILNGRLTKTEKGDPRGTKYTIQGTNADGHIQVGTVGRFTGTGRYLIITVYALEE